jgi:HSP20 family molecular chaperone IbpA
MSGIPPRDAPKGLEALAEIGRRLADLSKQAQTMTGNASSAGMQEPQERVTPFTIQTPAGPLSGMAGFSLRTLPTQARAGSRAMRPAAARAQRPRQADPDLAGAREPLVDCFDEGDALLITAELPGVLAGEIAIAIEDGDLIIRTTGARRYHARQSLPAPVREPLPAPECLNGILSLRLPRKEAP